MAILVSPPTITDAEFPYHKSPQKKKLNSERKKFLFEFLGKAVYEYRRNQETDAVVRLKSLPRGYVVEYNGRYCIKGHPSKHIFLSAYSFKPHLLWLDSLSRSENPPICECRFCKNMGNEEITSCLDISSSAENSDSVTIMLFPMTKVLIQPPKISFHLPTTCTIPLPKLKAADERILLNSLLKS